MGFLYLFCLALCWNMVVCQKVSSFNLIIMTHIGGVIIVVLLRVDTIILRSEDQKLRYNPCKYPGGTFFLDIF